MTKLDFTPEEIEICTDRIVSALGLARKAGKCVIGTELCVECIRNGSAKFVAAANDLSDNTAKRLKDSTSFHNIKLVVLDCDMSTLASRFGKKSNVACAAITDEGFVKIIEKIYGEVHTQHTEVQQ